MHKTGPDNAVYPELKKSCHSIALSSDSKASGHVRIIDLHNILTSNILQHWQILHAVINVHNSKGLWRLLRQWHIDTGSCLPVLVILCHARQTASTGTPCLVHQTIVSLCAKFLGSLNWHTFPSSQTGTLKFKNNEHARDVISLIGQPIVEGNSSYWRDPWHSAEVKCDIEHVMSSPSLARITHPVKLKSSTTYIMQTILLKRQTQLQTSKDMVTKY